MSRTLWHRSILRVVNQLAPIITMCITLALIVFFMDQAMPRFIVGDTDIDYPVVKQTLTTEAAAGLMFIYPFVALVIHSALKSRIWGIGFCDRRVILYWWDKTWCGMFVCFIFILFSEFLKRWVGRTRPNFLAMCVPQYTSPEAVAGNIVTNYTCESDSTGESCRSFPSGHSLFAILLFCAMGNLLEGHRARDRVGEPTWATRLMIQAVLTLIVGPALAITRYTEHYHHPTDVLVGIIGGYLAFIFLLYLEKVFIKEPGDSGSSNKESKEAGNIQEFSEVNGLDTASSS